MSAVHPLQRTDQVAVVPPVHHTVFGNLVGDVLLRALKIAIQLHEVKVIVDPEVSILLLLLALTVEGGGGILATTSSDVAQQLLLFRYN